MLSMSPPSDYAFLPLRYSSSWLGIGVLMLLTVVALMLLPLGAQKVAPVYSDWFAHALVFCILMIWFSGILQRGYRWAIFAGLLLFGALLELLQSFIDWRSGEFLDFVFNAIGLLIGWALVAAGMANWAQRLESAYFRKSSP